MAALKTDKIIQLAKAKTAEKERLALSAVQELAGSSHKVTFYSVAKQTGLSKTFLYSNESVRQAIERARESGIRKPAISNFVSTEKLLTALAELKETDPDGYAKIRAALTLDSPKNTEH
jgi:hypothetical protein